MGAMVLLMKNSYLFYPIILQESQAQMSYNVTAVTDGLGRQ
jgi:hypothetical protein